jgi:phosphoribosyl-ATP pyrophosphohydrolase/phosphoribosyl-AMP cyclohydrolase
MSELNFDKMNGLLPVVVQDHLTRHVLMVGFMNHDAYEKTISTKRVTFFSRKHLRLWTKGEQSGNYLNVVSVHEDCDHDTLLIYARPNGPVCHKGYDTCFNEKNVGAGEDDIIEKLEKIIAQRKTHPSAESYTSKLFARGVNKIAQKVGEEAVELVIEAKDNDQELFISEAADLLFHYLILLQAKGFTLNDVKEKLRQRHLGHHG